MLIAAPEYFRLLRLVLPVFQSIHTPSRFLHPPISLAPNLPLLPSRPSIPHPFASNSSSIYYKTTHFKAHQNKENDRDFLHLFLVLIHVGLGLDINPHLIEPSLVLLWLFHRHPQPSILAEMVDFQRSQNDQRRVHFILRRRRVSRCGDGVRGSMFLWC
jgi:hypothetical protein